MKKARKSDFSYRISIFVSMERDLKDWYFYQNKREDDSTFSMKKA